MSTSKWEAILHASQTISTLAENTLNLPVCNRRLEQTLQIRYEICRFQNRGILFVETCE